MIHKQLVMEAARKHFVEQGGPAGFQNSFVEACMKQLGDFPPHETHMWCNWVRQLPVVLAK